MRDAPNGKVIASIAQGTRVEILEENSGWSKIKLNEQIGYMMSQFLEKEQNTDSISVLKTKLREILQILDELED